MSQQGVGANGNATIVIFGASGDLTSRKLVPALFDNFRKRRLPANTRIVGVSRTPMSDGEFRAKLFSAARETLGPDCGQNCWAQFSERVFYRSGDVSQPGDYAALDRALTELEGESAVRVYYLSLKPELYAEVIEQLGAAGMVGQDRGARRVVIEKPFGRDFDSASELNRRVLAVLDESQVYRIDHYLGKETVQNLLAFRFANTIFEPVWNRNFIDHVQITVAENVAVGSRAGYYDTAGVLRDMFQNHLLQVLTLVTMEPPSKFSAAALRDEKVKVLNAVRTPTEDNVDTCSVLGQYDGYLDEPDVAAGSRTPTYGALRLFVDNWRWQSVPFYLRSGKCLAAKTTEVIIQFHCPPHMIFDVPAGKTIECNQLVITIQPDEGIHLSFQTKIPEAGMRLKRSNLYFHYRDSYPEERIPDAYERLLLDALHGDASLFIRKDEAELAWRVMDPIIKGWERRDGALPSYARGSWGPSEADRLVNADGRTWINGASLRHDE